LAGENDDAQASGKEGVSAPSFDGFFGGSLRAAIYARVSTADQHTIPEQVRQLEELARRRSRRSGTGTPARLPGRTVAAPFSFAECGVRTGNAGRKRAA